MGRPGAARRLAGPAQGGAAIRPNRSQLIALAAALALVAAVTVRAAALAGDQAAPVELAGAGAGLLLLAAALTGRAEGAAWGVAVLAGAYAGALAAGPPDLDAWAPTVAAAIVAAGEAGTWATELRTPVLLDRAVVRARIALLLGTAVVAAGVGLVLIAPGAGPELAGPLVTAAGVAAAVAAVAVIRSMARRA